jgi:hypothetical protein
MKQFQTPAETAELARIAAEEAAGGDPFGDNEDIVAESIETQAQAAAVALAEERALAGDKAEADATDDAEADAGEETADDATTDDAQADGDQAAGTATADADATATADADATTDKAATETPAIFDERDDDVEVPPLTPIDLAAIKTKVAELNAKEDAAFAKLMDGDEAMSTAEFNRIKREVAAEREPLQRQQAVAEVEANTFRNAENKAIARVLADAKKPENGGIDYATDQAAAKQWTAALHFVRADPAAANQSLSALYRAAHRMVAQQRGWKPGAAAAAPAVQAKPKVQDPATRAAPAKPPTLRGLPNAAASTTGNDLATAMGRLKGQAFEAAYAKLTPAQQAALVDD